MPRSLTIHKRSTIIYRQTLITVYSSFIINIYTQLKQNQGLLMSLSMTCFSDCNYFLPFNQLFLCTCTEQIGFFLNWSSLVSEFTNILTNLCFFCNMLSIIDFYVWTNLLMTCQDSNQSLSKIISLRLFINQYEAGMLWKNALTLFKPSWHSKEICLDIALYLSQICGNFKEIIVNTSVIHTHVNMLSDYLI